jgi:hypothetical protein
MSAGLGGINQPHINLGPHLKKKIQEPPAIDGKLIEKPWFNHVKEGKIHVFLL